MEFIDPINRGHARDLKKAIRTAMKKDKNFTVNKEINADKQTILHYCVLQGHLCLVLLLQKLKQKPNYDQQDIHGMTALHYACFAGNLEIIDELLYNTNVTLVSKTKTSAFHLFVNKPSQFSAPTKFERLYQTFINRGMDVNLNNASGDTPLHFTVQKGNEKITALLLSSGANPSLQNQNGETALHIAAKLGHSKILQRLIENGVNLELVTTQGFNAAGIAEKYSQDTIVRILKGFGLKPRGMTSSPLGKTEVIARPERPIVPKRNDNKTMNDLHISPVDSKSVPITPSSSSTDHHNQDPRFIEDIQPSQHPTSGVDSGIDNNNNSNNSVNRSIDISGSGGSDNESGGIKSVRKVVPPPAVKTFDHIIVDDDDDHRPPPLSTTKVETSTSISRNVDESSNGNKGGDATAAAAAVAGGGWRLASVPFNIRSLSNPETPIPSQQTTMSSSPLSSSPLSSSSPSDNGDNNNKDGEDGKKKEEKSSKLRRSELRKSRKKASSFGGKEEGGNEEGNGVPMISGYMIGDMIGKGGFGAVYKALDAFLGAFVAIKQMNLPPHMIDSTMHEINILKKMNHPNVIKYKSFVRQKNSCYIVMEFAEEGSLLNLIKKFGVFNECLISKYVAQILAALDYIHHRGIIHRDIKASNILITKEGKIKVADFGIAVTTPFFNPHHDDVDQKKVSQSLLSSDDFNELKNYVVSLQHSPGGISPYWMAPEIIHEGSSFNSDIWALGCTIIEMITGQPPLYDLSPEVAIFQVASGNIPAFPPHISPELNEFLGLCLNMNAADRPTARQLLLHPFILKYLTLINANEIEEIEVVSENSPTVSNNDVITTDEGEERKRFDTVTTNAIEELRRFSKMGSGSDLSSSSSSSLSESTDLRVSLRFSLSRSLKGLLSPMQKSSSTIIESNNNNSNGSGDNNDNNNVDGDDVKYEDGKKRINLKFSMSRNDDDDDDDDGDDDDDRIRNRGIGTNELLEVVLGEVEENHEDAVPDSDSEDEDEGEDGDDGNNNDDSDAEFRSCVRKLNELMGWLMYATEHNVEKNAVKFRASLLSESKVLREKYRDNMEARELAKKIRKAGDLCVQRFCETVAFMDNDSDFDSEDSFNLLSDDDDDDDDVFFD